MGYSLKHTRFKDLMAAGFTDEDIQKVLHLFEAVEMPLDLSPLLIVLTNLREMFGETVEILQTVADFPEDKLKSIESTHELILRMAEVLGSTSVPVKNVLSRSFGHYPVCALLCNKVSSSLTDEHKKALFVLSVFLLMFSLKASQKGSRKDRKSYFAENADMLRKFLSRKRDYKKAVSELNNLSIDDFSLNLDKSIQEAFPALQIKFRQDIKAYLLTDSDDNQRIESTSQQDNPGAEGEDSGTESGTLVDTGAREPASHITPSTSIDIKEDLVLGETRRYRRKRRRNLVQHDDEPEYIDTTEVSSDSSSEAQMSEVECAVIYGSRLDVYERQQLAFNPNVLADSERQALITALVNATANSSDLVPAAWLFLTLMTARTGRYVKYLSIIKSGASHEKECIDLSRGVWSRADVKLENAFKPEPYQLSVLEPHSPYLALPLPKELVAILHQLGDNVAGNQFSLAQLIKDKPDCVRDFLRDFNQSEKTLHRPVTEAAVRNAFFHELSMETSTGQAALTLANTEFFNPSHLYYLSLEQEQLIAGWQAALKRLSMVPRHIYSEKVVCSGSQLRPKPAFIKSIIKPLYERIKAFDDYQSKSALQLIEHHNSFVAYTALMVVIGTGHRVRAEYAFEYLTIDLANRLIFIADKLHFAESAIRYLPVAEEIHQQLNSYLAHLRLLSKALVKKRPELARLISANSQAYNNTLFPLLGVINNDDWQPVSASHLLTALGEKWVLPLNAFRHVFCSRLHEAGQGDFATMLMGHVSVGESLTDPYCVSSLCDVHIFKHVASQMLKDFQCNPVHLEMPRGKPVTMLRAHLSSDGPYTPVYLQQYQSRESDAKRLVKNVIKSCLKEKSSENLSFDEFAGLCRQQILVQTSQTKLQRTAASALFWCNRLLQRYARFKKMKLSTFQYLEEPANQNIRVDELYIAGTSLQLRKRLSSVLLRAIAKESISKESYANKSAAKNAVADDHNDDGLATVIISLVLHQLIYALPRENPDQNLEYQFLANDNTVFMKIRWAENSKITLLDSVSSLIALRYFQLYHWYEDKSVAKKSRRLLTNLVNISNADGINRDIGAIKALADAKSLHQYLSNAGDHNLSGLEKQILSGKSVTTPIDEHTTERVLFGVSSTRHSQAGMADVVLKKLKFANVRHSKSTGREDRALLNELRSALNMIKGAPRRMNIRNTIENVWQDFISADSDSINSLISASGSLSSVMIASCYYLLQVAQRKGKGSDRVRVSTLATYCSKVISPLLELHSDLTFFSLTSEDYAQIYRDVLEFRNTDDRGEGARRLRDFHTTIENAFGLEPVDWWEVEPAIFSFEENVSANLITANEYIEVFEFIRLSQQLDEVEKRWCLIILMLSFRLGLRIDELTCLKTDDIDFASSILHVRSNNLRSVKTTSGNRRIAFDLLLNEEEVALLTEQVLEVLGFHPGLQNMPVFCSINDSRVPVSLSYYVEFVRSVLRDKCGDGRINLHHGRHSFGSWMYLLTCNVHANAILTDELKAWFRTADLVEFRRRLFTQCLGKSYSIANRELYAIARLLGHSTPEVTLKHYVHLSSFIVQSAAESWISKHIATKALSDITRVSASNARKLIERNGDNRAKGRVVLHNILSKTETTHFVCNEKRLTTENDNKTIAISNGYVTKLYVQADGFLKSMLSPEKDTEKPALSGVTHHSEGIRNLINEILIDNDLLEIKYDGMDEAIYEIVGKPFYNYILNVEFKQVLSRMVDLIVSDNELLREAINDWKNALYQSDIILENGTESPFMKVCGRLGLFTRLAPLSLQQTKWIKLKDGKVIDVFHAKTSKRTWNRKLHYLLLLTVMVNYICASQSDDSVL